MKELAQPKKGQAFLVIRIDRYDWFDHLGLSLFSGASAKLPRCRAKHLPFQSGPDAVCDQPLVDFDWGRCVPGDKRVQIPTLTCTL
jgi:hypothetical protein